MSLDLTNWEGYKTNDDLINAKTKKEGWVNIYPKDTCIVTQSIHSDEARAKTMGCGDRIACVHIEWEE